MAQLFVYYRLTGKEGNQAMCGTQLMDKSLPVGKRVEKGKNKTNVIQTVHLCLLFSCHRNMAFFFSCILLCGPNSYKI